MPVDQAWILNMVFDADAERFADFGGNAEISVRLPDAEYRGASPFTSMDRRSRRSIVPADSAVFARANDAAPVARMRPITLRREGKEQDQNVGGWTSHTAHATATNVNRSSRSHNKLSTHFVGQGERR